MATVKRGLASLICTIALLCGCNTDTEDEAGPESFRIVLLADPHIPGPDYEGPEANARDTESIERARERLIDARTTINAIDPAPEFVVVLGDIIHDPYADADVGGDPSQPSAIADAAELFAGFDMPVYPVWGEHDYAVPMIPREVSHERFQHHFGVAPYYAVEHGGWRFIMGNTQLGPTRDMEGPDYDPTKASYGAEQLDWIAAKFIDPKPMIFAHDPMPFDTQLNENKTSFNIDLFSIISRHEEHVIAMFFAHRHTWADWSLLAPPDLYLVGSTRYDEDNFWLVELETHGTDYEILDLDKVDWLALESERWDYDGVPSPAD